MKVGHLNRPLFNGSSGLLYCQLNDLGGHGRTSSTWTYGSRNRYCRPTITEDRFNTCINQLSSILYRSGSVVVPAIPKGKTYWFPIFPENIPSKSAVLAWKRMQINSQADIPLEIEIRVIYLVYQCRSSPCPVILGHPPSPDI